MGYQWECGIVELDISEQDPEDMDLTDVVLEYDELVFCDIHSGKAAGGVENSYSQYLDRKRHRCA